MVQGHSQIQHGAVSYFQKLFKASPASLNSDLFFASIDWNKSLRHDQASQLIAPVTDEEIYAILKSMKLNKSPVPDGFNVNFFLHTWDIIGEDFTKAIKFFIVSGCLLKEVNVTAIALVPKGSNPTSMNDYRPISCCNTTYKCISKILAGRLKVVLPDLISQSQSSVVPGRTGRSIGDNILTAQELFRGYNRKSGPARCALKIDLRKAFDSISWDFLFKALHMFQFPPPFIRWVRACITSEMFLVKENGSLCGYFPSGRGLRQGDPLSPHLFVLAIEVLSLILHKRSIQPTFKHHWRAKSCKLTHLCFADDLLVFCNGDIDSVQIIHSCILEFFAYSGLYLMQPKVIVFLQMLNHLKRMLFLVVLDIPWVLFLSDSLGSHLLHLNWLTKIAYHLLRGHKFSSWTNCTLSYSGRLQLIKSVLFSIQSFWAAHFILPKGVLKAIQQVLCRFLWKGVSLAYGCALRILKIGTRL